MKRTVEQNKLLHTLLGQLRYDAEEKAELVRTYTNGRSASSSELTSTEAKLLIGYLRQQADGSIRKMRSKIINIGKNIGLTTQTGDIDWVRLNVFLTKKFQKKLHELTRAELPKAVTAMKAWRDSKLKKELEGLLNVD
jgi:hypothetical protein